MIQKKKKKDFSDELWKTPFYKKTKQAENKIIFKLANDSLRNWQRNLPNWRGDTTLAKSILDSIVCINSNSNKAIMVLLGQALKNDNKLDALGYFYGVKIKGKWYFFSGPTMFIPRKDLSKPTPFPQLHAIAMKEVFRGYLKKNANGPSHGGEWEINERFFDRMVNKNNPNAIGSGPKGGYGSCFSCSNFEEYVLYLSKENWKNKAK